MGLVVYGRAIVIVLEGVESWRRRLVLVMWGLRRHLGCCMSVVHPGMSSVLGYWHGRGARARCEMRRRIRRIGRSRRRRRGDGLEVVGSVGHGNVALATGGLHHRWPADRFHWRGWRRRRRRLGWWGFLVDKISKFKSM